MVCDYEKIRTIIKEENKTQFTLIRATFVNKEELGDFKKVFYKFRLITIVAIVSLCGSTGFLRFFI
jgi:hypothetical protein